jgi:hypothetical protein
MSLSMYQASIPAFVQMLNNISAIMDKAETHLSVGICGDPFKIQLYG